MTDAKSPSDDEPLLSLDTLVVRPKIAIDGCKFEILSPDELSVLESHRFGIWGRRIEALAEAVGEAEEEELRELVTQVARKVTVGVPDEVFDKLSGSNRMAIVDVFTGLLLRNRLGVAGAMAKAMGGRSIGELLSPVSSASSAEHPTGGWRKRLLRWFGRT